MKNTAKRIISFASAFTLAAVSSAVYAEEDNNTQQFGFAGADNTTATVDFGAVGTDSTDMSVVLKAEETYIITIPKEISLKPVPNPNGIGMKLEGEGTVSADNVFIVPKAGESVGAVNVIISNSSDLTISSVSGKYTLPYQVSDDTTTYSKGDTVLTVKSSETGSKTLKFTLMEHPKFLESYSGTIIFEVSGLTTPTDIT